MKLYFPADAIAVLNDRQNVYRLNHSFIACFRNCIDIDFAEQLAHHCFLILGIEKPERFGDPRFWSVETYAAAMYKEISSYLFKVKCMDVNLENNIDEILRGYYNKILGTMNDSEFYYGRKSSNLLEWH